MADIAEQLRSVVFRDPVCVSREAKLIEAMAVMAGEDDAARLETLGMNRKPVKGLAGCLVVVDHGKVLGLLTAQDMLRFAVQQLPLEHLTLREVLGEPPMTVRESALTDLVAVLNLFEQQQISYLPILDDGDRLTGLMSHESLLKVGNAIAHQPSPPHEQLQAELAARQQAETQLRDSEQRYSSLIAATPVGILHTDPQGICTYANERYCEIVGMEPAAMIGRPWHQGYHAEHLEQINREFEQSLRDRRPMRIESPIQHPDGTEVWVDGQAVAAYDAEGQVTGYVGTITDISDRKRTEFLLEGQQKVLERIAKAEPLTEILDALLQVTEFHLPGTQCSILLCVDGLLQFAAAPSLPQAYCEASNDLPIAEGVGSCGTAAFRHEVVIVSDIATNPLWQNYRDLALVHGLRACWSAPILSSDQTAVIGVFGIYYQEQRNPEDKDLELLRQSANIAGIAIERSAAMQALKQLNQDLENRVAERTAALQASEERWQLAVMGTNDAIWDWDLENNKKFYSSRWKAARGFGEDEIGDLPEECLRLIHPEDYETALATLSAHLVGETEFFAAEYRSQCKDGSYIWVSARGQALRDASGRAIRIIGSEADITQRKQAELALRESERRYASLAAAAPVAIFRFDTPLHCVYVNERWSELTGRPAESALGHGWIEALHPDDRERMLAGWTEAYTQPVVPGYLTIQGSEGRHLRPDGSVNWFYVQTAREFDEDGNVIGYVGTLTDITDRKQQEQERERLLKIIESTSDYIGFANAEGYILWHNQAFKKIRPDLGNPADRINLSVGHPAWANEFMQNEALPTAIEQGTWSGESAILDAAGNEVIVSQVLIAHKSEADEIEYFSTIIRDISDRKAAEQALTLKQNHLEALLNNIPHMAWIKDADSRFIAVNQPFAQACGTAREAIVGKTDFDIWPAELAQSYCNDDFKILQSGQRKVIEELVARADGTLGWLETTKTPFRDAHGDLAGTVGIAADITDRKQTEQALKESQAFVQKIADSSPNILYVYDIKETRNIYVNNEIATTLGYATDKIQAMGSRIFETLMHPDDFSRIPAQYEQINQSQDGDILEFEYRMRHANGEWRWLISRDTVFRRDETGQVKQTIGTAQDITDRKQAELNLEQELLHRNAIFNTSSDGIHILDRSGNLIEANASFVWMLGYSLAETPHLNVADWDAQWSREELIEIIQSDSFNDNRPFETLYRRKDGSIFPVEISRCPMMWNGQTALVCISRDISERKQAELQLQRTNEELARATRLKDEFLANMSHELRTPLNVILGWSEALQEQMLGPLEEQQLRALKAIEDSGNHLLQLINDILDVAKIESGEIDLDLNPTDIAYVCNSSMTFVKQQALKKSIQLKVNIPHQLPRLWVDDRRILQVLINLLSNAVKFTPEGGRITLAVTCYQQGNDAEPSNLEQSNIQSEIQAAIHRNQPQDLLPQETSHAEMGSFVQIAITDTGIGIAPGDIARLFQPFVQIDSALNRQYTGTGLGLALVKRITELHGGVVELTSEVGVGSCFTIKLPCETASANPEQPPSPEETAPLEPCPPAQPKDSPLILIAEDNEANVSLVMHYFECIGYRLLVAINGLEAIELAKTHHPNLILMDIQMPQMDGMEAIARIRQDKQIQAIPIIALTALAMKGDEERCLVAGANAYLSKPVKLKQLNELVIQLLEPIA